MCGICGIFDLTRKKRNTDDIIKRMTGRLLHRGSERQNEKDARR
jgi:asparagine synthetase B (glutamine-hydrolysing)